MLALAAARPGVLATPTRVRAELYTTGNIDGHDTAALEIATAEGPVLHALFSHVAPGFFRQMLPLRDPASFNPQELGIGLGLTNGLGWGLAVGVLLVAIIAWKETRLARKEAQDRVNDSINR
jgi:hypothetical protein